MGRMLPVARSSSYIPHAVSFPPIVCALVYSWSGWEMRNARSRRRSARHRRLLRWLIAALAVAAAYGAFVAPRLVDVSRHAVTLPNLPEQAESLRIVQISDLHAGPLFRAAAVRRIVRLASSLRPDVVVLTGDFVSYRSIGYLPDAARELARLRAPSGVFAALGNHDHWEDAPRVRADLRKVGIRVLVNENVRLRNGLFLAGVDDLMSGEPDLGRTLDSIPRRQALIILSHNPTVLPELADRSCLILAGHTHGGNVALPFLGPRGTMALPGISWFAKLWEALGVRARGGRLEAVATYRYPAGWYAEGRARMYVSRGVGVNQATPLRLNCRPEIAVFDLIRPDVTLRFPTRSRQYK